MTTSYDRLKRYCNSPIDGFYKLGEVSYTPSGVYIYRDNPSAKILGVAHLDTVLNGKFRVKQVNNDVLIFSPALDDRLGVYTLIELLPQLGIEFDLLLTEGEESGMSTAEYFKTDKKYNWMFSFDRRGDDVVMYQYDDKETREDLVSCGLKPGIGSFSDIAFLSHLGIKGFNFGTGYYGEHSNQCLASMGILRSQIQKFKSFYDKFNNKKYDHTESDYWSPGRWAYKDSYNWGDYYDNLYCYLCARQRGTNQVFNDIFLCDACLSNAGQCESCHDVLYEYELADSRCMLCEGYDG